MFFLPKIFLRLVTAHFLRHEHSFSPQRRTLKRVFPGVNASFPQCQPAGSGGARFMQMTRGKF